MVHVHNGILSSRKKEGAPALHNSYLKYQVTNSLMPYFFICILLWMLFQSSPLSPFAHLQQWSYQRIADIWYLLLIIFKKSKYLFTLGHRLFTLYLFGFKMGKYVICKFCWMDIFHHMVMACKVEKGFGLHHLQRCFFLTYLAMCNI